MRAQLLRLIAVMVVCLVVPMLVSGCGPGVIVEQGAKGLAKAAEKRTVAEAAEKMTKEAAEKVAREKATKEAAAVTARTKAAAVTAREEAARLAAGQPLGRGHSRGGHWKPNAVREKLAMDRVMKNPAAGEIVLDKIGDPRWYEDGWIKKRQKIDGIVIHYLFNTRTGAFDDLKFKRGDDAF